MSYKLQLRCNCITSLCNSQIHKIRVSHSYSSGSHVLPKFNLVALKYLVIILSSPCLRVVMTLVLMCVSSRCLSFDSIQKTLHISPNFSQCHYYKHCGDHSPINKFQLCTLQGTKNISMFGQHSTFCTLVPLPTKFVPLSYTFPW